MKRIFSVFSPSVFFLEDPTSWWVVWFVDCAGISARIFFLVKLKFKLFTYILVICMLAHVPYKRTMQIQMHRTCSHIYVSIYDDEQSTCFLLLRFVCPAHTQRMVRMIFWWMRAKCETFPCTRNYFHSMCCCCCYGFRLQNIFLLLHTHPKYIYIFIRFFNWLISSPFLFVIVNFSTFTNELFTVVTPTSHLEMRRTLCYFESAVCMVFKLSTIYI